MIANHRRMLALLLLAALAILGVVHLETFGSIVRKWNDDAAFSHGFLILPISLWLAWRKRLEFSAVEWRPAWFGVAALLVCAAAWIVAGGTGVLVIEQLAAVMMIAALVLAILGWPATRTLLFPLAFLLFAVPFGRGIVPVLMQATADMATFALQWSGVPVLRSHMYISIPAGDFEVARACSGLNYVVTGLVLGVLYAYVSYRGWRKRLLCVAAFLVVPIVANGVRVYLTILMSHLTDMRFGPGTEHVTFGRIFFILVMLLMFWIGRRWHDAPPPQAKSAGQRSRSEPGLPGVAWGPVPAAILVVLLTPVHLASSLARADATLGDVQHEVAVPLGVAGWQGPLDAVEGWRPLYGGGLVERQAAYSRSGGPSVDVFVAVYGLGATRGREMIAYDNALTSRDSASLAEEQRRKVVLPDGGVLVVNESRVNEAGAQRVVWYWFLVGDRPATNPFAVKALEAVAFVVGGADSERIVTLSTTDVDGATARLEAFVSAHAACVNSGFAAEACGG